jgi:small-conductance mechanosensitive channel
VIYLWLVFALSRFEVTRGYTDVLTGLLTKPLLALAERLAFALPLGLLALCFGALVYVLVRFVELFFVSVRRGETELGWLPSEIVPAVSVLARAAIVLLAVVFAGPIVTGDSDGALSRAGAVLLFALSLAATPLCAAALVGAVQMLSGRVRMGAELEIAGRRGRVHALGFFDVTLIDTDGHLLRVPHLLALFSPLRAQANDARTSVTITVAPGAPPSAVKSVLLGAAEKLGARAEVELRDIDATGQCFRVSLAPDGAREQAESTLRIALAEALAAAGFGFGHKPHVSPERAP